MSTGWMTTRRQPVEIRLSDRSVRGDIHLQPVARLHGGPETPADLLNRNENFFALMVDGEQPLFVAKAQVLYLAFPAGSAIDDPDRASAARRIELEIELADGSRLEGVVMIELPPDRLRALDFLNAAPDFFPLWTPELVRIVNRHHVRAASPVADVGRAAP